MAVKLKKRVKKKWVEALRSGKYEQGRKALSQDGKYCCLGVLCEVALEAGLPVRVEEQQAHLFTWKKYDGAGSFLPERVYEWATLKKDRAAENDFCPTPAGSLSYMNDTGKSFNEIADLIEEYL